MTLEFIAGCLVALFFDRLAGRLGRLALAAGLALLFGGWAAYRWTQPPLDPWGWQRIALFGMPSLLIVYGAVAMEQRSARLLPRVLRSLGDASYSLYLSHTLVVSALALAWSRVGASAPLFNVLALLAMFAAAIGCGLLGYQLLERPLLAFCKRHRETVASWVGVG
jgi:peptidoglycan/LPS O-acetylase OafA/YrhL